ncbi:hypothetical protein HY214_04900 [Candidatus Roizmanbacteria bacterium]|nr:hypothetical protein [Candidatus Roizmanbacteria bacterium]
MAGELFPRIPYTLDRFFDRSCWTIKGSTFRNYLIDFAKVDADDLLPGFLKRLSSKNPAVVIDLMASNGALRTLHRDVLRGGPLKALSVDYQFKGREDERRLDLSHGIECLEGDLNHIATWRKIEQWLSSQKAHLIMERGYAGLDHIPTYGKYFRSKLGRLWRMLADDGMLLLQTPPATILKERGVPLDSWLRSLEDRKIYYRFLSGYDSMDAGRKYGLLMLSKTPRHTGFSDMAGRL